MKNNNDIIPQNRLQYSQQSIISSSFTQENQENNDSIHKLAKNLEEQKSVWSNDEISAFIEFYMHKYLSYPLTTFSVFSPLKRQSQFEECSEFINKTLGEKRKTRKQCKNKYTCIKKKILRKVGNKMKKEQIRYDFVNYVIQWGLCNFETNGERYKKIQELEMMTKQQSQFMLITKELLHAEEVEDARFLNNDLMNFIIQQEAVDNLEQQEEDKNLEKE